MVVSGRPCGLDDCLVLVAIGMVEWDCGEKEGSSSYRVNTLINGRIVASQHTRREQFCVMMQKNDSECGDCDFHVD